MVDMVEGAGPVEEGEWSWEMAEKAAGSGVDGSESLAGGRLCMAAVRLACAARDSRMGAVRVDLASGVSGPFGTFLDQTVVLPPASADGEVAAIMAALNRGEVAIVLQGCPNQVLEASKPWEYVHP